MPPKTSGNPEDSGWPIFVAGLLIGMFLIFLLYDIRGQKPSDYVDRALEAGYAHYDEGSNVFWDNHRARYVVTGEGGVEDVKR